MPRSGGGVYSVPAGTTATPNTSIESAKYNAFLADLTNDLNAARPIVAGGTGATTKSGAQQALDLEPGVDIQAYNATLAALAALTLAADKLIYATGANTLAAADLTAFARTLLAGVDAAAMRTTLGLGDMATKDDVAIADIDATGTADATTFLRGDGAWMGVFGAGQTWKVVSRAVSTVYQNTSGRPIAVGICAVAPASSIQVSLRADVTSTMPTEGLMQQNAPSLGRATAWGIIPAGWYYEFTEAGGPTSRYFWEIS